MWGPAEFAAEKGIAVRHGRTQRIWSTSTAHGSFWNWQDVYNGSDCAGNTSAAKYTHSHLHALKQVLQLSEFDSYVVYFLVVLVVVQQESWVRGPPLKADAAATLLVGTKNRIIAKHCCMVWKLFNTIYNWMCWIKYATMKINCYGVCIDFLTLLSRTVNSKKLIIVACQSTEIVCAAWFKSTSNLLLSISLKCEVRYLRLLAKLWPWIVGFMYFCESTIAA